MENWIKNLKAGDKVIVRYNCFSKHSYSLEVVEKITPKGYIKVNNILYNNTYGFARGGGHTYLLDYNDERNQIKLKEDTQKIFIRNIKAKISNTENMTYEQAMEISKIMGWTSNE